jgi:hypothetical protein
VRELERLRSEVAGPRKEAEADATQAKGMHHKARQEREARTGDADRRGTRRRRPTGATDAPRQPRSVARLNRRAAGFSDQRATERGRWGQLRQ